jgi:hypothetical protein
LAEEGPDVAAGYEAPRLQKRGRRRNFRSQISRPLNRIDSDNHTRSYWLDTVSSAFLVPSLDWTVRVIVSHQKQIGAVQWPDSSVGIVVGVTEGMTGVENKRPTHEQNNIDIHGNCGKWAKGGHEKQNRTEKDRS